MTDQDIQQFAEALAVRYKQTEQEYQSAAAAYQVEFDNGTSIQDLNGKFLTQEKAYVKYKLFIDVIETIPQEIKHPFYKHLGLI